MLSDNSAAATIPVKDLRKAKSFYEDKLGLKPKDGDDTSYVSYGSGDSSVLVYTSQNAGTNRATAATWDVGAEIGSIVKDLKAKGVPFEHYDMPGLRLEGDIHVGDGMKVAWVRDPDGNILALAGE